MRLFYSKIICLFFLVTAPFKHVEAQEQFLRLDSVVVLHGNMNAYGSSGNIYGRDSIVKPLGINQIVKVRNVQVTIKRNGSQTPSPSNNNLYTQLYGQLYDVFVEINNDVVYDVNTFRNGINSSYWGGNGASFTRISSNYESNMFFNSDLNVVAGIYGYEYGRSLNQVITYRIELIYYSYE